ncbi:MAG: hypothetical protein AB7O67_19855 [Vicinamibacterales bacterium]
MDLTRLRRTCQIVALLLLCQTALDLANPALCALDAEDLASVGATSATLVLAAPGPQTANPAAPAGTTNHVDDCFCCSGCVEAQPIFHVLPVEPVAREPRAEIEKRVALLPSAFDHPPQFLS